MTAVVGVVAPVVGALLLRWLAAGWIWGDVNSHVVVEVTGALVALGVAATLLELRRQNPNEGRHVWVAGAVTAIGVIQFIHTFVPGEEIWAESLSTAIGGLLLACVWLPARFAPRPRILIPGVLVFGAALSALPLVAADYLPSMVSDDGYTPLAHAVNMLGGAAFLAATTGFLLRYRRAGGWDDFLFAVVGALLGTSGFVLDDAAPWTALWWWWHALHVLAYGLTLVFTVRHYVAMTDTLRSEVQDRERAEAELRESRALLHAMFDSAADGILTLDDSGRLVSVNPSAERMFGIRGRDVIGEPVTTLLPKAELDHASVRNAQAVRGDGTCFPANLSINRFDAGGRQLLAIFVRDVSEQAELEDQLRHSQKMEAVGTLASGVAHDFNNLLMGIRGCAEVAQSHLAEPANVQEHLEVIRQEASRGAALTKQLLSFGRKQASALTALHADSVIAEIESMLRNMLGEDIELDVRLSGTDAHLLGDRGQLEQVLLNLAINARDAMPTGGRLSLQVEEAGLDAVAKLAGASADNERWVLIAVRDTGTGMPPEVKERIFEPFFTTKDVGEGTGLGLAMVYGIMQRCGGAIDVSSTVGGGTTFTLCFPWVESMHIEVEADDRVSPDLRGSETILVVEDQASVRRTIRFYLERWGYSMLESRDGREAIAAFRAHEDDIDLVLSDVVLPGMSGPEVAKELRAMRGDVPVIFMSAYTNEVLVAEGRVSPGTLTLHKPFSEGDLVRRLRQALGEPRAIESAPAPRAAGAAILLVEDHAAARLAIGELLRDLGHRVLEASGGAEALQLCDDLDGPLDVVVSDIRLPDMPGPDLVASIRERDPVAVVYVSGLSRDDPVVQAALAASDATFVQKPADFDDLERAIKAALSRRRDAGAPEPRVVH